MCNSPGANVLTSVSPVTLIPFTDIASAPASLSSFISL